MDALRAMFPDVDPAVLEATLSANGGSVERAVDFLLTGTTTTTTGAGGPGATAPPPTGADAAARAAQEAADLDLARRLQAAETADPDPANAHPHAHAPHPRAAHPDQGLALPSLSDVGSAVQPLVDGVLTAGRAAAQSVSQLYADLVGDAPTRPASTARAHPLRDDDSVVLRGDAASSPGASRTAPRQRRPESPAAGRGFGDKKDD